MVSDADDRRSRPVRRGNAPRSRGAFPCHAGVEVVRVYIWNSFSSRSVSLRSWAARFGTTETVAAALAARKPAARNPPIVHETVAPGNPPYFGTDYPRNPPIVHYFRACYKNTTKDKGMS